MQGIFKLGHYPTADAFADFAVHGWTEKRGEVFVATAEGLAVLGEYEALPTGMELRQKMIRDAGPCEAEILGVLFKHYPDPLTKADICGAAGYVPSGTTANVFAKLSKLNWMVKDGGGFRASDDLFEDGGAR